MINSFLFKHVFPYILLLKYDYVLQFALKADLFTR